MEMKQVSGIVCYVSDLAETERFYRKLGFHVEPKEQPLSVSLGSFWIDCIAARSETKAEFLTEAKSEPKGGGLYLYIEVIDVNAFYRGILKHGLKPSGEPKDWPWGNREFVLRDPDSYKLVFFHPIKK
jgi:catechol 2,3-dioxygenase-like lactoylglutathione lyase family enzyme